MEHTLDYTDLTDAWLEVADGRNPLHPRQAPGLDSLRAMWQQDPAWVGATVPEMKDRVKHGFTAAGMTLKPARNVRPRSKYRYAEEGELQIDLALSGHDMPFLNRQPRKRQAGLKLDVELAVLGGTQASVLEAYGRWVAELIQGLQQRGADLEINIVSSARNVAGRPGVCTTRVRVKRFGRKSSLKSWGAIFSPSGFRMLIFLARTMTADKYGIACHAAMGGSFGPSFGVEFDPKDRHLTVKCGANAHTFPVDLMNEQLAELSI